MSGSATPAADAFERRVLTRRGGDDDERIELTWRDDLTEALDVRRPGPAQHARLKGLVLLAVRELGAGGEHVAARALAAAVTRENDGALRRIKRALAQLVSDGRLCEAKRMVHDGQRTGGKANGFALPPEDIERATETEGKS
jgi:hypothetical protein